MRARAQRESHNLGRLVEIMRELLGPGGCPWDKKQTHKSLRPYLIEEAYELLDAIDGGKPDAICDELGDLLFQVVFHAEIARQSGQFTLGDVVDGICDKLVRRHPHVFANGDAKNAAEVGRTWNMLKRSEGKLSACDGGAESLPALRRALQIGSRLSKVGFDWKDSSGPRNKIDEELAEIDEALIMGDAQAVAEEMGDLLFAVVNFSRHLGTDPEDALRGTLKRFEGRFRKVEDLLRERGLHPEECSLDELESLWEKVKAGERS